MFWDCAETPVGNLINYNIATCATAERQPGSTSQLLVECSCGSREPRDLQQSEISSRSIWCDYSRLNRRLTTRRLNYREIKVLISPKCAWNSSGRFAISFSPFHQKSFCCPRHSMRNKHARLGSLYILSRTCQKQPESITKTVNPVWGMRLNGWTAAFFINASAHAGQKVMTAQSPRSETQAGLNVTCCTYVC